MNLSLIVRIIWPKRGTLFLVLGGVLSVLGDFSSFLASFSSPYLLILPALVLAVLLAWFCIGRVRDAAKEPSGADDERIDSAVKCHECDVFRVMLFATIGLGLLMIAGQGTTATEQIASRLGLIQHDVAKVKEDTTAIRAVTSSSELLPNPRSASDFFHNARIYSDIHNDNAHAWESLQELYRRFAPNKLDAAMLYFNVGSAHMTRDALLAQMASIGQSRRDASMLVIAGRNAETNEQAWALYDEARAIDPRLPFAYWDTRRVELLQFSSRATQEQSLQNTQTIVAGLQRFLKVASENPLANYYFVTTDLPDWVEAARNELASYSRIEEMSEDNLEMSRKGKHQER